MGDCKRKKNEALLLLMGCEGSGKTVSAIEGYAALAEGAANPKKTIKLSLDTKEPNERGTSGIEEIWKAHKQIAAGAALPGKTKKSQVYSIRLKKNGEEICCLTQCDSPGGLRSVEDPSDEQINTFEYFLKHAALLGFVLPGELLAGYSELSGKVMGDASGPELKIYLRINQEMNHVKTLLAKADELAPTTPLLFCVTKSDKAGCPEDIPDILERLLREWQIISGTRKIVGCSSTLGRRVTIRTDGASKAMITGGYAPEGYETPLLLAAARRMYVLGRRWAKQEQKEIDEAMKKLQEQIKLMTAAKAGLKVYLKTKWVQAFRPEKYLIKELEKQIQSLTEALQEKEREWEAVSKRNYYQKHAEDILAYIESAYPGEVMYIDKKKRRRKLQEFI